MSAKVTSASVAELAGGLESKEELAARAAKEAAAAAAAAVVPPTTVPTVFYKATFARDPGGERRSQDRYFHVDGPTLLSDIWVKHGKSGGCMSDFSPPDKIVVWLELPVGTDIASDKNRRDDLTILLDRPITVDPKL